MMDNFDVAAVESGIGEVSDPVSNDEDSLAVGPRGGVDDLVSMAEDEEAGARALRDEPARVSDLELGVGGDGLAAIFALVGIVAHSALVAPGGGNEAGKVGV